MSERSNIPPAPEGEYFESSRFAGMSMLLGLIAFVALALCGAGVVLQPAQLSFSWLFAFAFYFTLCAGCFFWTIVHHATDAEWSVVVRRQLENIAVLFAVLAVFFIPILLLRHHLYEWMNIAPGKVEALDSKRPYLNFNFFVLRAVIFLGFFIIASQLLRRFSIRQDKDGNPQFTLWMRKVSFVSLPLFAFCLTFGAFDWLMSLNYHWFSTMFGVYIFAGTAGSSMSLLVLIITGLRKARVSQRRRHARALPHHGEMDVRLLRFLGLHRFRPVHAHLVREHAGGDADIFSFVIPAHGGSLACFLSSGDSSVHLRFCSLRSIKKHPHQLCYIAWLDRFHATARHVHRGVAGSAWHRCAFKSLGLRSADRNGRDPRIFLPTHRRQILTLPGARSAAGGVAQTGELNMADIETLRQPVRDRARHSPPGSVSFALCFVRRDRAGRNRSFAARR